MRGGVRVDLQIEMLLEQHRVRRYFKVKRVPRPEHTFKQTHRGRPGPDTEYRRLTKRRYDIQWTIDQAAIDYDKKSDGMYPLICNDRALTAAQVLVAHKGQPMIEKRFEQLKTVHEIAPVFLKNTGRIEAFFTLYFFALLLQALIERQLRLEMQRRKIPELPIYPEKRRLRRATIFDGTVFKIGDGPGQLEQPPPVKSAAKHGQSSVSTPVSPSLQGSG